MFWSLILIHRKSPPGLNDHTATAFSITHVAKPSMQDTSVHFLSNNKACLFPFPKPHTFPSFQFHHDLPSFSCPKSLHLPSLSYKTTTIPLPSKPPKSPKLSSILSPPPSIPPSNSEFQEKMLYLDSLGIDMFSLINHHCPIILSSSLSDIKSTFNLLTSMNFTSLEFRRIVSMCPEILNFNATPILSIFTFLLREACVNSSDLKRVINRRPRLLTSSIKHCLRPTLYFLQSMGIAEVKKHTYLLSCGVEDKLIPRIQYFEKIGFSYTEAVSMFRRFPQLFNYSIKNNVEPKLNYFVVEMGRDLKELKEFPQYFSFSLENRIKPRHQSCTEKGVCFPLRALLKSSEAQFRSRLEVCCNSSIPFSASPLSSVNYEIIDYNAD